MGCDDTINQGSENRLSGSDMNRLRLGLLGVLLVVAGCVRIELPNGSKEMPASIGTLRSRHHTVHVYAGVRYTIQDAEGNTLATLVTDEELQKQLPKLSHELHQMFAGGTLWAGM